MNLITCEGCGIVLNKDVLDFPHIYDENYGICFDKAEWNGNEWVAKIRCPVCGEFIPENSD